MGRHSEGPNGLTGWQPLKIGHPDLDHEAPAWLQMRGDVLEAGDLLILRRQVHDRVEDQVGETRTALDSWSWRSRRSSPDLICAGLRPQPGDHRVGQIDAVYADAALGER